MLEGGRHHRQALHHLAALEQHVAKRGLRAGMALLGGEMEPAPGLLNAGLHALSVQEHLADLELRVRVAVGRGRAHVIFLRRPRICAHRRIGDPVLHIAAERHQRIGDIGFVRAARLDLLLHDLLEELERLVVVAFHAVTLGIHARQLPARADLAVLGGIFVGLGRLVLVALLIGREAEPEDRPRAALRLRHGFAVDRQGTLRLRGGRTNRGECKGSGSDEIDKSHGDAQFQTYERTRTEADRHTRDGQARPAPQTSRISLASILFLAAFHIRLKARTHGGYSVRAGTGVRFVYGGKWANSPRLAERRSFFQKCCRIVTFGPGASQSAVSAGSWRVSRPL